MRNGMTSSALRVLISWVIAGSRALRRAAAAAHARVGLDDVLFGSGLVSLSLGVYQIYAPAAPIVAGAVLMWVSLPPAPPATKEGK